LELGCGNGAIGEYISDRSGAHLTGVDGSTAGIQQAQARTRPKVGRLSFQVGDMSKLRYPCGEFDTVIAIDTVYYDRDMSELIASMQAITGTGGQMGVFYSTWQEDDQPREAIKAGNTLFYQAAAGLGLECQSWDFTRQEIEHWTRKYAAALELEAEFAAEGQQWLREKRLEEAAAHMVHVRAGRVARYFYRVIL
jgi:cyclopropane fatty-acyl-phospholipid synthase-like methyltransferase